MTDIVTTIANKSLDEHLNVKVGADPELFLKDIDGNIIPAFFFVEGTKEKPEYISGEGHAVQYDNVMLEYNIPPCKTEDEFVKANNFVLDYIKESICAPNKLTLSITASEHLGAEYLHHEIANVMGCSADFNAYTEEVNHITRNSKTLRSTGGHLHCSYKGLNYPKAMNLIQALDLFISVPLVLMEPDSERKTLYGKAGAHRFKQVNKNLCIVEYRSPSNFWCSSEKLMRFVYQQIIKAVNFVEEDGVITNPLDIINAINDNNSGKAREIIDDYNIEIDKSLLETKENKSRELISEEDLVENNEIPTIYENDSLGG